MPAPHIKRWESAMRVEPVSLQCPECRSNAPIQVRRIGTSEHRLVVHCQCAACERDIYLVQPLADCWRDYPRWEDQSSVGELINDMMQEPDIQFLRSMGVAFPDEKEC
jgi:hypothetical protein